MDIKIYNEDDFYKKAQGVSFESAIQDYMIKVGETEWLKKALCYILLPYLISRLKENYPELKKYNGLARFLKDCYFERRYENDDYIVLEQEEYESYLVQSIEMIDYLRAIPLKTK